jgi:hypothetical protein
MPLPLPLPATATITTAFTATATAAAAAAAAGIGLLLDLSLLRGSSGKVGQSGDRWKGIFKAESFSSFNIFRPNCRIWQEINKFWLIVVIPRLSEPTNYHRFSVWFLNPGGLTPGLCSLSG